MPAMAPAFLLVLLLANIVSSQTTADTTSYYTTSTVYYTSSDDSSTSVYYTSNYDSSTSVYYTSSPSPTTFYTASSASTGWPAFPTAPFTGQALLIGTCTLPQYTILNFPDGGAIEVPLIGCSDDRPECCPGIVNSPPPSSSTAETEGEQHSTTSWTATTPSPLPTGVVSALSQNPLSVCPSDMVDLDPVCCPIGYKQYGQSIIGNLPCVSTLTSTVIQVPTSVLASISSAVAASLASTSTSATPTVTVVINQVFALGLPCKDEVEPSHSSSSLSTGAKAGIGAGIGAAGILLILFLAFFISRHRKHKKQKEAAQLTSQSIDPKHASVSTNFTGMPSPQTSNPGTYYQPQPMQPGMQVYPHQNGAMYPMPMQGYVQPHSFPPTFGYAQQQYPHQSGGMYPGVYPGYQSMPGSPPPPFSGGLREEQKPVEVDGGVVHAPPTGPAAELSGSEGGRQSGSMGQSGGVGWGSNTTRS